MSKIEWTSETWNPVVGCTPVSAGCANCYAVKQTHRLGAMAEADERAGRDPGKKAAYRSLTVLQRNGRRHFNGTVRCVEDALGLPLRWKKPRRVFVNSMSDLFHEDVPFQFIDRVFAVMALCPQHEFQVLTKRPERMAEYLEKEHGINEFCELITWCDRMKPGLLMGDTVDTWTKDGFRWYMPHIWLGTSVEDKAAADERIPHLLRCPARIRFLSCEPLLGNPDLSRWLNNEADGLESRPTATSNTANIGEANHPQRSCVGETCFEDAQTQETSDTRDTAEEGSECAIAGSPLSRSSKTWGVSRASNTPSSESTTTATTNLTTAAGQPGQSKTRTSRTAGESPRSEKHSLTASGNAELASTAGQLVDALSVDLRLNRHCRSNNKIDWVIVGGESGPGARPCDVAWIRSIVDQCKAAGVACFVKQLGARAGITDDRTRYVRGCGFWPVNDYGDENGWILRMNDRKGGDPGEWPEALRVREFPLAQKEKNV